MAEPTPNKLLFSTTAYVNIAYPLKTAISADIMDGIILIFIFRYTVGGTGGAIGGNNPDNSATLPAISQLDMPCFQT